MAKKLRPQQERFFEFLTGKSVGDIVSEAEILAATGWKPATVQAYRVKHILDPFLTHIGKMKYRVLREGSEISKGEIAEAFTQKKPEILVLTEGLMLTGAHSEYQLEHEMGQGAVAHVWGASSTNGERFAVKVMMPRRDLLEPTVLKNVERRFVRESANGTRLSHPNIVAYRDLGEIDAHPFLVMDLADKSVAAALVGGPLSLRQSLPIIADCVSGLEYLHARDCVHRDIKPANVLQFGERHVLGDLGIVQWSDMNKAFTSAGTITRDSVQLGSWYYMAPEQRRAPHQVTFASDIYALGITWYEIVTGRTPDPAEVGAQVVEPATGNDLADALIQRMMSFNPSGRSPLSEIRETVARLEVNSSEKN